MPSSKYLSQNLALYSGQFLVELPFLNTFAGRLGGRMNKIDEIIGDD